VVIQGVRNRGLPAGGALILLILLVLPVLLAGCMSSTNRASGPASGSVAGHTAPPIWLCQPGTTPNPCESDLDAEVVTASGARTRQTAAPARDSPFDCFYVYPTVSSEKGPNADLRIQPAETFAAEAQAARFSSVCRVWAPMYRQVTLAALFTGGTAAVDVAYASLLSGWQYYLQHDNGGRPIIFVGHSQGAAMLIRLLAEQIDPNPTLRARMVVAILAGGNLQVPTGLTAGATFSHIPLCTSTTRAGCAIAYSAFGSQPPADAFFGRPGTGVSFLSGQGSSAGQQVACVNPAALGGGAAGLSPYFRGSGAVPWTTYPGLYRASCRSAGGATWLQVDTVRTPGDTRPRVTAGLGPEWGYHGDDMNLTLGNLVADVSAFESAHGP
jgi:hypothetical protein